MSDFGVSMPSWWVGGNPNAGFQANLAQNQAAMANNQNFFNNNANIAAQNQASLNNAYGPGGFGGDTARYAAIGAAYGRGTGGFGGLGAANADPFTPVGGGGAGGGGGESPSRVPIASSPFDTGNAGAAPYLSGGGMPFGGGGFGRMPTVFDTGAQGIPNMSGGGMPFGGGGFSPGATFRGAGRDFNQTFGDAGWTQQMQNQPAINAVNQFGGRGTGVGAFNVPSSQPNPFDLAHGAFPSSSGSFGDRFSIFNRGGSGTPSEYTTEPYTDAQGQTHQPNIPPGYQTPFSADNPGGALTRGMRQNIGQAPIMNQSGDEPSDTLTAGDRAIQNPFDAGASHIGPTMGPFMSAGSGAGWGRRMAPPDYAPSSPFGGGASPVPYPNAGGQAFPTSGIGSAQGGMRDRIAAAMSGAGGNTPPSSMPPPPTSGPTPTQPQMNDAWRRIGAGPGSPGVSSIAQPMPPPQAPYGKINQAIYDIGNVSRPGMFDNTAQPLGQMFSPGQYGGGLRR